MSSDDLTGARPAGGVGPAGAVGRPGAGAPLPTPDPAEALADEIVALPGVVALHGGMFGEVATYLPGRRVTGIRRDEDRTDVHVSVEWGSTVHDVAESVRRTTTARVGGRVDVYVEDVVRSGGPTP